MEKMHFVDVCISGISIINKISHEILTILADYNTTMNEQYQNNILYFPLINNSLLLNIDITVKITHKYYNTIGLEFSCKFKLDIISR